MCYTIVMKPIADRLWAKTTVLGPNECWEWNGYRYPAGHGQIGRGRRGDGLAYTHVVSWELMNGKVPDGLLVCHSCDNPPCINPNHLFIGTHADNTRDMVKKRRHSYGELCAKTLNNEKVREIRKFLASGETQQIVAQKFGVSRSLVGMIGQFKRWALTD
jgi:hypothetical protein